LLEVACCEAFPYPHFCVGVARATTANPRPAFQNWETIMSDLILHHYPPSPFAEKIRRILGFKQLAWRGVTIPRMMPKPDLMPLTGGYRKTPIMQIGADVYCDTACIAQELERRFPAPTLFPGNCHAIARLAAAFADRILFSNAVGVTFGTLADSMPKEFVEDRAKFSDGLFDAVKMKAEQSEIRQQMHANFSIVEAGLADGRAYLLGDAASYADFALCNPVWFIRSRVAEAFPLARYPRLSAWIARMDTFGTGSMTEMSAEEALATARGAKSVTTVDVEAGDISGLKAGDAVVVAAEDMGRDPVQGSLLVLNAERIAVRRSDPRAGEVVVHFPRVVYRVRRA
jgi:glutathione S-transferase